MEMKKKNLVIILLVIMLVASGIGNIILAITGGFVILIPKEKNTLIIGFATNPTVLDPVDTWDVSSFQVQQQVIQGLVQYNVSGHPNYDIIPVLATGWTWTGADHVEFDLRPGVKFHDGTDWDADAALWNLNRLMWFYNYTGTLPDNTTSWLGLPCSLYFAPDGETPYITSISKINNLRIAIDLSFDFAPFLDLLCFAASFMCSPTSTPKYSYLDIANDVLVGTGPFLMDLDRDGKKDEGEGIYADIEVRLQKNDDFWGVDAAGWKKSYSRCAEVLVLDINEDDVSRNMDMLTLKIDFLQGVLPDMIDTYNTSIYHTVNQIGEGLCYFYLSFYSNDYNPTPPPGWTHVNVTWRKALQMAVNYTYIVEEIFQDSVVRGPTVVPRGMPGHNATADANKVDMDIPSARALMQSMGFGVGWDIAYPGANEPEWSGANFRTVRVNEYYMDTINQEINTLITQNWDLIGINIDISVRTWAEFLDVAENAPWSMDVTYTRWCPDYLDAFNMLEPLFSNTSHITLCHLNDPYMMSLLNQAARTTSPAARQQIYMHIQSKYFDTTTPDHEWKYPHAPLFAELSIYVHSADLTYTAYNVLSEMWAWEMELGEWED